MNNLIQGSSSKNDGRSRHSLHKLLADNYVEARKLWDYNRAMCYQNGGIPDEVSCII